MDEPQIGNKVRVQFIEGFVPRGIDDETDRREGVGRLVGEIAIGASRLKIVQHADGTRARYHGRELLRMTDTQYINRFEEISFEARANFLELLHSTLSGGSVLIAQQKIELLRAALFDVGFLSEVMT